MSMSTTVAGIDAKPLPTQSKPTLSAQTYRTSATVDSPRAAVGFGDRHAHNDNEAAKNIYRRAIDQPDRRRHRSIQ